jgi:hypothetical protein
MRRSLAFCVLSVILLAGAGCARTEPVFDVRDESIPAPAQGLPRNEIGRRISEAAARARWRVDAAEPGRLWATYDVGKHAATANVTWTERAYSISLVSTNNLEESGGQVHRTYNVWVRNLEREINDMLYLGSPGAAAPPLPASVAARPSAPSSAPVAAAARFSDSVPFACPPPGTEIEFLSGSKRVFGVGDGIYCPYESAGQRKLATPFGVYSDDAARALTRLWPLKLGSQVSFTTKSGQALYRERYRVTRRAQVTVRAGTFEAFIIDWTSNANGGGSAANYSETTIYSETASFWYAPEIGYIVKVQHKLTGGTYPRLADDEVVRVATP